ncbi:hypothetical protein [Kitasatospora sp. NPDC091276]|uniref:hypothetical protein n=1 Tax=Kitasatospora sp. NPDC091276 TaxID=3155300 RepID=UPI003439DA4C
MAAGRAHEGPPGSAEAAVAGRGENGGGPVGGVAVHPLGRDQDPEVQRRGEVLDDLGRVGAGWQLLAFGAFAAVERVAGWIGG